MLRRGRAALAAGMLAIALAGCADPRYAFDGSTLDLRTDDVRVVLGPREQVEPDLPLGGTRWAVTRVTDGPPREAPADPTATLSAGMAPEGAHLMFAEGQVTGSDGCNPLRGDAEVRGDTIRFGPVATTKRACAKPGPDEDAAAAVAMRAVLDGEVAWLGARGLEGTQLLTVHDEAAGTIPRNCVRPEVAGRGCRCAGQTRERVSPGRPVKVLACCASALDQEVGCSDGV